MKLPLDKTLSKLAILKIRPILAKLPALSLTGIQKNANPSNIRNESRVLNLSAKKFSGPIAIILIISSIVKIQTKISSRVPAVYHT